ncbi:hypothetical protein M9H77_30170 [Catharanthus roseus]|uniref:Uncharacterized protein n=1 Tax=Catharanthus roseus TaxID=4058 RepID=A0ACB9ZYR7_CATRO|nr:hypothetical protein M9H77_30170 [Catharanthus roseus]
MRDLPSSALPTSPSPTPCITTGDQHHLYHNAEDAGREWCKLICCRRYLSSASKVLCIRFLVPADLICSSYIHYENTARNACNNLYQRLIFAERNQILNLSMAKSSFQRENTLERGTTESSLIRKKYPDRIPMVVEKARKSDISDVDKKKYLVPAELTIGQFVYVVRRRINLTAEKSIFVFINDTGLMSAIYEENKDEDGFLYMSYSGENTFGLYKCNESVYTSIFLCP